MLSRDTSGGRFWDPTVTAGRGGGPDAADPRGRGRRRRSEGLGDATPNASTADECAREGRGRRHSLAGSLLVRLVRSVGGQLAARGRTRRKATSTRPRVFDSGLTYGSRMGKQSKYSTLFCTTNSVRQEPRLAFQPVRTAPPRRRAPTRATLPLPFAMGGSGYAGYAPGHKVAALAPPWQQYLKAVKSMATLDTLEKLTRNSAQAPAEEKFRKVRPTPRRASSVPPPPSRGPPHPPPPFPRASRSALVSQIRDGTERSTPRQIHRGRPDSPSPPPPSHFAQVRLTNEKIAALITDVPGAKEAMPRWVGWRRASSPILPAGKSVTSAKCARLTTPRRAQKWEEEEFKKRIAARNRARQDPEKARLLAQMAADRAERAARDPVTQSSVAAPRGESRVQTATQAGCRGSSGG